MPLCKKARANVHATLLAMMSAVLLWCGANGMAQEQVDVVKFFQSARSAGRDGVARKTKAVDVRPAKVGETVITLIKGEGKETQSPLAKAGDMVVRNRCPETGNEEFLVAAATFAARYQGPTGRADATGWVPYQPRGVEMRYITVTERDGAFTFTAPWGETMVARPGDAIVQDLNDPKNTYRVQQAAFACTYEVVRRAK